jgi:hypothetical protein
MIEYTVKVLKDGTRFWHLNGKLHREDGPAIEDPERGLEWFLNGLRHRTDGPAIEQSKGRRYWFLNGEQVTEEEVMKPAKELTVAEIEKLLGHKVKILK